MRPKRTIQSETETIRYHGWYFLDGVAMLLGLVLHAPQFNYIPQISEAYTLPEL